MREARLIVREAIRSSAVFVVFKKAAAGLGAEETGANQTLEERTRPEARLAALVVQVLHPVEHPVEPGAVRPFEGPDAEFEAHLHRQIDLGRLGHAFHHHVHRFVDQRQEHAGRDKARHFEDLDRDLAEQARKLDRPVVDLVCSQLASDDLDHSGGCDRINEVHSDDALRAAVLSGELRDRQSRCRQNNRVFRRHPTVELAQDLPFETEILLDSLEREIAVGGAVEMSDPGDS